MGLFDFLGSKDKGPKPISFLSDYVDFHQIIGGSQSTLYTAKHAKTGQVRAVKKILPKSDTGKAQLMRELEICFSLRHEFLIEYLGYEKKGDEYYILMEYFPGLSLRLFLKDAIVKGGRKPPYLSGRNYLTVFSQAAQALAVVHTKGYLHLDFKPENLLVQGLQLKARDETVMREKVETEVWQKKTLESAKGIKLKLIDFGLSIRAGEKAPLGGSTFYIAPEVVGSTAGTGGGSEIGQPADIFSLGCTMYELCTGTPPWMPDWFSNRTEKNWNHYYPEYEKLPRETRQMYEKDMLKARLSKPVDVNALGLAQAVRDILAKCLHPSPAKRYTTTAALVRDLDALLHRY